MSVPPASHVSGNRHVAGVAGFGDNVRLSLVLLGVEDVVLHTPRPQENG